jgi:DNA phosphorothioation-associated putative methyltransferase
MRRALADGLITPDSFVFDYGCGRGGDLHFLQARGIRCAGWDPAHMPNAPRVRANVVNIGYVINVIEDPTERALALKDAWQLAADVLVVTARLSFEQIEHGTPYGDGVLTGFGTFQKYYQQQELRGWLEQELEIPSVPAAPGIFYVFRDSQRRQAFLASRYRRANASPVKRRSDMLFEEHRSLFERLTAFITARGRLPDESEIDVAAEIRVATGSLRRAFRIVERVIGRPELEAIRQDRAQDLLVYLALARFDGRPAFHSLPRELQFDVRAFFSTYAAACTHSDRLLFSAGHLEIIDRACENASVGKLTPSALYIHSSALANLPPILRVYEGCARSYVGTVDGVNVIKLHRLKPQVSYLGYPAFERDPHPALSAALIVPLNTLRVAYRDYTTSSNPPILHRKEEFLARGHPLRERFARLTRQEERYKLYEDPQRIGTVQGWQEVLEAKQLCLKGHRVLRRKIV